MLFFKNFLEKVNLSVQKTVYTSETGFELQSKGGDGMEKFEKLLESARIAVERFVRFRVNIRADAEDILQDVYLAAYQKFPQPAESHLLSRQTHKRQAWK